jgi:hypothetical protein
MKETGELGYGLALCGAMRLTLINLHTVETPEPKIARLDESIACSVRLDRVGVGT